MNSQTLGCSHHDEEHNDEDELKHANSSSNHQAVFLQETVLFTHVGGV